ncbi:MAG: acetamidase/formamidase family protein [Kiritimatiellae bacterium]|nr:acetamidase/formamidase family protein [Kiritimatiellia bacterium]
MQRITKDKAAYSMSCRNAPVAAVQPGETVVVETEDCYSGRLKTPRDRFTSDMWNTVNPATGPLAIAGIYTGQVLGVRIEDIATRDYAVMCVEHNSGALGAFIEGVETTILPIRNQALVINKKVQIPIRPMIGVIGTAPRRKAMLNGTPGEHGGNMDCNVITRGCTVYLPVQTPGALLMLGDIHALMGDGEVCICAAEVAGEITLTPHIVRRRLPTPCVETASDLHFIASAKSLDTCERRVLAKAIRFLTGVVGIQANNAARLMSLVGDLRVCQVVDPLKTMRFTLPKIALADFDMRAIRGFE